MQVALEPPSVATTLDWSEALLMRVWLLHGPEAADQDHDQDHGDQADQCCNARAHATQHPARAAVPSSEGPVRRRGELVPAITSYNDYMTSTRSSSPFTSPRPQAGVSARVGLS